MTRKTTRYRPVIIWKTDVPRPERYAGWTEDSLGAYLRHADAASRAKDWLNPNRSVAQAIDRVIIRKETTVYTIVQELPGVPGKIIS